MSMNSFHSRKSRPAPVVRDKARPARLGLRLDQALVDQGLAPSRSVAQRLIASGGVSWEGRVLSKPSQEVPADARLEVVPDEAERYVSRGALKLEGALRSSGVQPQGLNCLDVGQSTGGFTDCLLQAGAARVVGVDVGHGQLHPRLQADPRVQALEGINCRTLDAADLGEAMPPGGFDLIVADVSFISLTLILPRLPALLAPAGQMLLLVKPQFEVGPGGLGKGGLVRDPALYAQVEQKLRQCCAGLQLEVSGWFNSPITGGDGNREFFIWTRHAD